MSSAAVVGKNPDGTSMATRTTSAGFGTHCALPESVTNAQNETSTVLYRYDFGVPISQTDPNGLKTSWQYDNYARKTRETRPDSTYSTYTLYSCNTPPCWGVNDLRFSKYRDDYGSDGTLIRAEGVYWDGMDRLRYDQSTHAFGTLVYDRILGYDSLGRQAYQYQPVISGSNGYFSFLYDLLDRKSTAQLYQPGGALDRTTTYQYAGRAISIIDPKTFTTTRYVNVLGQLGRVVDPSPGGTTNYTYEPFGNLASVADPASNVTSSIYNLRGFLTSSSHPDRGSWTYSSDSLGERLSQTDAKSQSTGFAYDKLSRMVSRTEAEGTSTWVWGSTKTSHNFDQLQSLSGPGYSESRSYDNFARLLSTTYTADTTYTISRGYNATTGLLDNVTYPASTGTSPLRIQYAYSYGILSQVNDFNTPATVYWQMTAQDAWMNPTNETLFNGVQVLSNHDAMTGHLNSRTSGNVSPYTNQQDLTFNWDKNENLTDRIDVNQANLDEHFNYDPLNRMSGSTLAGVANLTVAVDATGNITSKSDIGTYTYSTTHKHAVASTSDGYSYMYDNNGNMLTGRAGTFAWTSYNLPGSITNGSMTSAFSYTPGRRYWKQAAMYSNGPETTIYIGGLFEKVSNATITDYHHLIPAGSATVVLIRSTGTNNQTYYVTRDPLSSSAVVTNSTGALILNASFAAYGGRRGSNWTGTPSSTDYLNIASTTRHGFTGHTMLDNLNLIHMNGRVFDSEIGRFVSADPVMDGTNTQTINPYGYVGNNPLSAIDPTGYFGFSPTFSTTNGDQYPNPIDPFAYGADPSGSFGEPDPAVIIPSNPSGSNGRQGGNDGSSSPPFNPADPWNCIPGPCTVPITGTWLPNPPTIPTVFIPFRPGRADGGSGSKGSPHGTPQSQTSIKNWLCRAGNSLASASDSLGNASGNLELAGVAIGVAGLVTAQPEVAGPGFALAATGGLGSIGAGALQFGAGLLQGFGGGGFGNSFSAVATLGAGVTIGRFITGPSANGYLTVSQRATDSFLQNTAMTTGGVFDTLTSFIEQLGPQQVPCP